MLVIETTVIRPRKKVFYIISGVMVLLVIIYLSRPSMQTSDLLYSLLFLSFFILIFYFSSKKKIIFDNNGVLQELAFRRMVEMKWTEIQSSRIEWHSHGHGANQVWEIQGNGKNMLIYADNYSKQDLRKLAEALVEKARNAQISEKVRRMAEGRFPWYQL